VDDLVAYIDRRAILLERTLDDLDRPNDARAKSARLRKIHFHGMPVTQIAPNSFAVSGQPGHLRYPHHARFLVSVRAARQAHGRTGLCDKNTG
jgi:hypothetical protein